jgi:hypothetical protein
MRSFLQVVVEILFLTAPTPKVILVTVYMNPAEMKLTNTNRKLLEISTGVNNRNQRIAPFSQTTIY